MNTMTVKIPDSVNIRNIAIAVRQLKGVSEVKVQREKAFERIPGLPYTDEERIASVREAMQDVRAGRVYSAEDVRAMFPRL